MTNRRSKNPSSATQPWFTRNRVFAIGTTAILAVGGIIAAIVGSDSAASPQNNTVVVNVPLERTRSDQKDLTDVASNPGDDDIGPVPRLAPKSPQTEQDINLQARSDRDTPPNPGTNWLKLKRELDEAGGYLNLNEHGEPVEICFEGISNDRIGSIINEYSDLPKYVTYVSCDLTSVNDTTLRWIGQLDRAHTLRLNECDVKGQGLGHITKMESLSRLSLRATQIQDESLTRLIPLTKLERLNLSKNAGIGKSLQALSLMKNLQYLGLWETEIDTSSMLQLGDIPNLGTLAISSPNLSNDSLRAMADAIESGGKFRRLTELYIDSETDLSMDLLDRVKAAMEKHSGSGFVTTSEPDSMIWK